MKIYFAHSKQLENPQQIYSRLESLTEHNFIFPYKDSSNPINSKEIIKSIDLIITEVSYASTGLGVEIGWAESFNKPVICVYKKGSVISNSLKLIKAQLIEYSNIDELEQILKNLAI